MRSNGSQQSSKTKMAKKKAKKKTAGKKTGKKVTKKPAKKKVAKKKAKKKATPQKPTGKKPNTKTAEEELTVKQKLFGDEYLKDFKGGPAYKKIYKCSAKAAEANASRLLKTTRMQGYLQRKVANIQAETEISASEVLKECNRIAMADPIHAYNADGTFKRIQDIPIDLRRCIAGLETEEVFTGKGKKRQQTGRIVKLKYWSKDKQTEHLLRYKGLFEKDNEQQTGPLNVNISITKTYKKPADKKDADGNG